MRFGKHSFFSALKSSCSKKQSSRQKIIIVVHTTKNGATTMDGSMWDWSNCPFGGCHLLLLLNGGFGNALPPQGWKNQRRRLFRKNLNCSKLVWIDSCRRGLSPFLCICPKNYHVSWFLRTSTGLTDSIRSPEILWLKRHNTTER